MCNQCQMLQIYILDDVNIYLINIVYKTCPDPLHHFSGQPLSTSSFIHERQFTQTLPRANVNRDPNGGINGLQIILKNL